MFEQVLGQIVVVSVFVERLVNFVKLSQYNKWAEEYQKYIDYGLVLVFNVGLCYLWQVDIFSVAGLVVEQALWLGAVLTGVLAGLGSEVIHKVIDLLKLWKQGPNAPAVG